MTKAELIKALEPYPADCEIYWYTEDGYKTSLEHVDFINPPINIAPFIILSE